MQLRSIATLCLLLLPIIGFALMVSCAGDSSKERGTILDEPSDSASIPVVPDDFLAKAVSDSSVIQYRYLEAPELEAIFSANRGATAQLSLFKYASVVLVMARKSAPILGVSSVNGNISSPNAGDWAISMENGRYAGSIHVRSRNETYRIVSSGDASSHVLMQIDPSKTGVLPGGTMEL